MHLATCLISGRVCRFFFDSMRSSLSRCFKMMEDGSAELRTSSMMGRRNGVLDYRLRFVGANGRARS
jgi:hypothetical protein